MDEWLDGWMDGQMGEWMGWSTKGGGERVSICLGSPPSDPLWGRGNSIHSCIFSLLLAPVAPGQSRVVGGDGQAKRAQRRRVRVSTTRGPGFHSTAKPPLAGGAVRRGPMGAPSEKTDHLCFKPSGDKGTGLGRGLREGPGLASLASQRGQEHTQTQRGGGKTDTLQTGLGW